MLLRSVIAASILIGTAATAQVTSYTRSDPPPLKGDGDRIVCKKVEKIGTRLGARKVCLTVREWTERKMNDRDETNRIVSGAKVCQTVVCD